MILCASCPCDYTNLLKAASAVEIECERGRGLGLHSKGGAIIEVEAAKEGNGDESPVVSSVASMESKIDHLTTIVKSAQKVENKKCYKGKSPKTTPKKMEGPATTAAGPF